METTEVGLTRVDRVPLVTGERCSQRAFVTICNAGFEVDDRVLFDQRGVVVEFDHDSGVEVNGGVGC